MKPVLHAGSLAERGTLTAQGAVGDALVSRLADGDIGLPWIDSTTGAERIVTLDLGLAGPLRASTWVLAAGHNLTGVVVALETGPNLGGPWAPLAQVTPASPAAVRTALPTRPLSQCWRLRVLAPPAPPRLTEWVLSDALTLPSGPQEPSLVTGPLGNVQTYESPAGYTWTRKKGAPRWEADYQIRDLSHEERAALESAFAATDEGARPIFLDDADGVLRWVYWLPEGGKLAFQAEGRTRWRVLLRFREAL